MAELNRAPIRGVVEKLARRDSLIVMLAALTIVGLAAWYTYAGAGLQMMAAPVWTLGYGVLNLLMWWVMMIAMMTPSAAPMLLLYAGIKRLGPDRDRVVWLSLVFLGGYLLAWGGFSVIATTLQWRLETQGLSDGAMMPLNSRLLAAILLLLAGGYQFSGVKDSCLAHCRAPGQFLADHNQPGGLGALRLGLRHGSYCLGCCWALMALLFVGGIMNLYWIAGLALYVLAEKMLPNLRYFSQLTGGVSIGSGGYLLVSTLI